MRPLPALACAFGLTLLAACGATEPSTVDHPELTLRLAPAVAGTATTAVVDFKATFSDSATHDLSWSVNGVAGGSAALGTVTAAGSYHAPSTVPDGDSVVVTAAMAGGPSVSAPVYFYDDIAKRDYDLAFPRVVDIANPVPTRLVVVPTTATASITFVPRAAGGVSIPFDSMGNGLFTGIIPAATSIAGYQAGTMHNFIGYLDYRQSNGGLIKRTNLVLNIRDAGAPAVTVTPLDAGAQRSPYILNIRCDTALTVFNREITQRAITLLGGDKVDFFAIVMPVNSNNNRAYSTIRNDVTGIGKSIYDNDAIYGASGKLYGVANFPLDGFFDAAERGFMHEMGHRWMSSATDPLLSVGNPHWPLSTMATYIMGYSIVGGVGGTFPFTLTSLGDGTVRTKSTIPAPDVFNSLDLYIMGLLPPDSVPTQYILSPTVTLGSIQDGQVLPATSYTSDMYIASHGTRVPGSSTSPRDFSAGTIVLSFGRLMTPSEMAFFDQAAARGETRVQLMAAAGVTIVPASGWYIATGGRSTMTMKLPP